jgi:hypothetical protein
LPSIRPRNEPRQRFPRRFSSRIIAGLGVLTKPGSMEDHPTKQPTEWIHPQQRTDPAIHYGSNARNEPAANSARAKIWGSIADGGYPARSVKFRTPHPVQGVLRFALSGYSHIGSQGDHVKRTDFMFGFRRSAGACRRAQQPSRICRLGYLSTARVPNLIEALQAGLRELGYIEGKKSQGRVPIWRTTVRTSRCDCVRTR